MHFYEFFAGGGMARIGLGSGWNCLFANDIDPVKAECYRNNFQGAPELCVRDIAAVTLTDIPGQADLAWASFPCQDLSLAGAGSGLKGKRSGAFWPFWSLMEGLCSQGRAPRMIVLENVRGAITSHGGRDLASICELMTRAGYCFAPLVIDAQLFLPQSRPRLFIIAWREDAAPPSHLLGPEPSASWHPDALSAALEHLSPHAKERWNWLSPPHPEPFAAGLEALVEETPSGVEWRSPAETRRLLDLMTDVNRGKVAGAMLDGILRIGTVYRRTRPGPDGVKRQRAEVRFDGVAGCLRTPGGGSSRQTILAVKGREVRSRLLSAREAARLMGLPDDYVLPRRYNDAYKLAGDGVAVPAVAWLARHVLEPSLAAPRSRKAA
jgi:DNA (cytosine-5)-methyltransferase 1